MAVLPPRRVCPTLPAAERPAAPADRASGADKGEAENALLISLVRALARQAAVEAWDAAMTAQPEASELLP